MGNDAAAQQNTGYRTEHDTMGEVQVPADALYAAQTQRAVENFPISGRPIEPAQIRALGLVKGAAARVNKSLGVLDAEIADAIAAAADEVASGAHDDQFPIDVFQTGSGTSSNMNANEVIATLASRASGQKVHPNDHVNASQSSNDVFPTTIHLAATEAVVTDTIPGLDHLGAVLNRRAQDWRHVVKAGRTHLMDAVPITLGQEAGGWATQCSHGTERLRAALPRLGELPIGGTAVGTGINTPEGFGDQGRRRAAPGHRHPRAHRGPRPHRGPGSPRRPRRDLRRRCAPSPSASTRSPTTCAGSRRDPRPASPRSTCPTCSPAARSCPARSTR